MALITCPECKYQISDQAATCPHCGYPLAKVPTHNSDDSTAVALDEAAAVIQEPQKKMRKGIIIGCIAVVCIILVAVIGFITKHNSEKAIRADYIANLNAFLLETISGAAEAESVCNLTRMVWYDTIHEEIRIETVLYTTIDGEFNEDFNDSLSALYASDEIIASLSKIKSSQDNTDTLYMALQNPSEEFETCFDIVEDLYSAYRKLTNLALSPSGSLNTYSEAFSEYDSTVVENFDKLSLLIPEE